MSGYGSMNGMGGMSGMMGMGGGMGGGGGMNQGMFDPRYKTKLCMRWMQNGDCSYGAKWYV